MRFTKEDYIRMKNYVLGRTSIRPRIGAVLGTGLDSFLSEVKIETRIPFYEVPGLPASTNKAHKGQFVLGTYHDIPVILMQGRLHYYEGYSSEEITAPIRMMALLGIKGLLLTNAAGGIEYPAGTLMLIRDHISVLVPSPLIGTNIDSFGPRFPAMGDAWDKEDREKLLAYGKEENLSVKEGVYMVFTGPQFESPAEIYMASVLGADAVGMSTVPEALVANHMGLKTLGISLITNCHKESIARNHKLTDEEVVLFARKAEAPFSNLAGKAIELLAKND